MIKCWGMQVVDRVGEEKCDIRCTGHMFSEGHLLLNGGEICDTGMDTQVHGCM